MGACGLTCSLAWIGSRGSVSSLHQKSPSHNPVLETDTRSPLSVCVSLSPLALIALQFAPNALNDQQYAPLWEAPAREALVYPLGLRGCKVTTGAARLQKGQPKFA